MKNKPQPNLLLQGAIDRHKLQLPKPPCDPRLHQSRNVYVNPATVNRKYVNPATTNKAYVNPPTTNKNGQPLSSGSSSSELPSSATRELVIDGVAFESSTRKLTRKDRAFTRPPYISQICSSPVTVITKKPESSLSSRDSSTPKFPKAPSAARSRSPYGRKNGNFIPPNRVHKPKYSKRLGGHNNMVLDNIKGTR